MDYTDDDGFSVGQWQQIDRDTYWSLVRAEGGLDALTPFACATEPERRVYTEWGRDGDETPLLSHERLGPICRPGHGDDCSCDVRYRRFVLLAPATA